MNSRFSLFRVVIASGLLFTAAHDSALAATAPAATAPNTAQIEQLIHDYILANPEVVLESVRAYDKRAKNAEIERQQENVVSHLGELHSGSPIVEPKDKSVEPVTVVEFFDYRCGYCKKVEANVAELAHVPGVRIVYKDLPILGPESQLAAQAALAADKQGQYSKFRQALLTAPPNFTQASIEKLAAEAGLDVARLKQDMVSTEIQAALASNRDLAEKLGVQATPTFVVGTNLVSGALTPDAFKSLIEAARIKQTTAPKSASAAGF